MDDNPFDLLQLDPRHTPRELTEMLRRRAERAMPEERAELQGLWRKLTLKERDRLRWALLAHPRTSRSETQHIAALQEKIPPFISRYKPPALVPTLRDLLVAPPDEHASKADVHLFTPPLHDFDDE